MSVSSMVATAPASIEKGSPEKKVVSGVTYALVMGGSTVLGIFLNEFLKSKIPNPTAQIGVDIAQIGGGSAVAGLVNNDIAKTIGLGQSLAGGISVVRKIVDFVRGKVVAAPTSTATTTSAATGW